MVYVLKRNVFRYKHDKNALIVSVVRCRDLPAKDPNLGSSDPYVKLQLLPDKQHKVKTRVLRKTRNPVYDEDFTFYGISFNQLPNVTLHFVVLSFDRYSRDDIIGEVFCPLNSVDVNQMETQQIALCKEIQPRSLKVSFLVKKANCFSNSVGFSGKTECGKLKCSRQKSKNGASK